MADRKLDEYKNVKFYAENTKAKQAGFSKFDVENDFFFCRYIDGNVAMISQAYTSAAGRDNGIASVKKNEKLAKRYVFETRGSKSHGFALKAGNGQEIAISPNYASLAQAELVSGRLTGKTKAKKAASTKSGPKKAVKATAAAAAFTPADERIENYKPLAFYQKHGGKTDGFNSFEKNGAYYFHYNEGGEIVLISESYTSKAGRDNGIASVKKNIKRKAAYQQHTHKNGKHYFDLNAGNHQEVATSRWYGSAAAAAAGAAYLLGTRRRVAGKTTKPAAAASTAGSVAVATNAKAAAPKRKSATKKTKPALAAGTVAVAALGASAAAAKTNAVKKAAIPVKAGAFKAVPVTAATPVAAVTVGTAAVAGAAAIAATPKAEPVTAAPNAAAAAPAAPAVAVAAPATTTTAAAVAEGGGIWGWLKWVLMALIALLAIVFLMKSCVGGDPDDTTTSAVTTTQTAATAAMITCWNGSKAEAEKSCPTKVTCWDNSFAADLSACPVNLAVKDYACWDGSKAVDVAGCPAKPLVDAQAAMQTTGETTVKTTAGTTIRGTLPKMSVANATAGRTKVKMSAPSITDRICAPSSNPLFDVSASTPVSIGRLGTNPQFGNSLTYTPDEFFRRLQVKYRTSPRDKSFLDLLARSLGYGAFADMDASMFSNDTLTKGSSGLLGFGSFHALQFSTLNVRDQTDLEAFKVQSVNGTDVHFMKRCGNYMYVCQP